MDSNWQKALVFRHWKILRGDRFPQKCVNIIKMLYEDFHCKVICGSTQLTDSFSVQTLWKIRLPQKYVNIITMQYEDFHYKVICGSTPNCQTAFNGVISNWQTEKVHILSYLQSSAANRQLSTVFRHYGWSLWATGFLRSQATDFVVPATLRSAACSYYQPLAIYPGLCFWVCDRRTKIKKEKSSRNVFTWQLKRRKWALATLV